MWEIEFYEKENGRCPVGEYLDSVPPDDFVRIERKLKLLAEYGNELQRPHVGYLRDDIWELRVRTQRGQNRILFFFFEGQKIILTNGFLKKTRKVPPKEIERAIEYRKAYFMKYKDRP